MKQNSPHIDTVKLTACAVSLTRRAIRLYFLIPLLFISILSATEIEDDFLEITYHSISNNDTVQIRSGLVLSFSKLIDLVSLNAVSINYISYYYEDEYHTDSTKMFIQSSQNITLNGTPLSFWYDSETYSCAFLNESTVTYPDGTGIGFPIVESNTFIIQNIVGLDSSIMNGDFELAFYNVDEGGYNVVPNPFVYPAIWGSGYEPNIYFIHLPVTCTIYIFTIEGDTVNYIEHDSGPMDGTENWVLEDLNGDIITSGIYLWGIETSEFNNFKNGVLFTVLPDMELSLFSDKSVPMEFSLKNNYPNPFNPVTTITYDLPELAYVNLTIYNLLGKKVTSLVSETQDAGYNSIQWDATNVASGMYFYQIRAGQFVQTRKMVVLK